MVEHCGAAVERLAKDRLDFVQLASHPHLLRPLAGEEEAQARLAPPRRCPAVDLRRSRSGADRLELLDQIRPVLHDSDSALAEPATPDRHRVTDVLDAKVGSVVYRGEQLSRSRCYRLFLLSSEHQRMVAALQPRRLGLATWPLFEHHVCVRPAEAEAADRGDAPPVAARPGGRRAGHSPPQALEIEEGIDLSDVEVGRNLLVHQRKDRLDHTRHSRDRQSVRQVGLGRPDTGCALLVAGDVAQGANLDGIAEAGARSVGLDVPQFVELDASVGQRSLDQALLRTHVWRRERGATAILVDGGAADEREDLVAVALCSAEPL